MNYHNTNKVIKNTDFGKSTSKMISSSDAPTRYIEYPVRSIVRKARGHVDAHIKLARVWLEVKEPMPGLILTDGMLRVGNMSLDSSKGDLPATTYLDLAVRQILIAHPKSNSVMKPPEVSQGYKTIWVPAQYDRRKARVIFPPMRVALRHDKNGVPHTRNALTWKDNWGAESNWQQVMVEIEVRVNGKDWGWLPTPVLLVA